jgi:cell division protein ZipA
MAEARRQVTASQAPTAPTHAPIAPQPIQPAPVAPQVVPPQPIQQAPATTPAPTQPTDWMGDFSQIKKREPVAPTAVTPEPVAPAPVTTTTPKTVKPEVPVINRQQEIQNNLATGYQTNP